MTYKFLPLLFFCGVCFSAFGQELQSPQINQNAIFANPGLAGSKGQTRICTTLSSYISKRKYYIHADDSTAGLSKRNIYNGMVSIDGLIMKNKLGVAGYLKNESLKLNDTYTLYQNNTPINTYDIKYKYANLYMGFMLAPKFQIAARKLNKQDHVLSPAVAIGFRGTQFNYSGPNLFDYTAHDSLMNGDKKTIFKLDYTSLSLVYSSPKSYSGIKFNFENYRNTFLLYNISFLYAKTYSKKNIKEPKFSFTHQFQLTIPTYGFYRIYRYDNHLDNYIDDRNNQHLNNYFNANLDFRYGKFVFGNFIGANNYNGIYGGLTGGIQLENARIIINYSPKLSFETYGSTSLFVSANFLLKPKRKTYR